MDITTETKYIKDIKLKIKRKLNTSNYVPIEYILGIKVEKTK
jgi:hypothetical protein